MKTLSLKFLTISKVRWNPSQLAFHLIIAQTFLLNKSGIEFWWKVSRSFCCPGIKRHFTGSSSYIVPGQM